MSVYLFIYHLIFNPQCNQSTVLQIIFPNTGLQATFNIEAILFYQLNCFYLKKKSNNRVKQKERYLESKKILSVFPCPASVHVAHLMVRRSQPRMAMSFAVASWLQLWWGLHLPEVNLSWPLPSQVAVPEICKGQTHSHYQTVRRFHSNMTDSASTPCSISTVIRH